MGAGLGCTSRAWIRAPWVPVNQRSEHEAKGAVNVAGTILGSGSTSASSASASDQYSSKSSGRGLVPE